MKGQGSREVVEELKKERLTIDVFLRVWFTHTRLMFISDLGLDKKVFAKDQDCIVIKHTIIPSPRYFTFCNVLLYVSVQAIPTYRVYRLYDKLLLLLEMRDLSPYYYNNMLV